MWKVFRDIFGSAQPVDPLGSSLTVIALGLDHSDRVLLSNVCERYSWPLHFAETSTDAWSISERFRFSVVLCNRNLPESCWKEIFARLKDAANRVRAILVSRVVDANLWDEVVQAGGSEVIPAPLHEETLVRSIRLSLLDWKSSVAPPDPALKP